MKRTQNDDDGPTVDRLTLSNPRKFAEVADWPIGRQRCRARFQIEAKVGHGERVARVTENKSRTGWNKPKRSTYSTAWVIADGSDGRLYLVDHSRQWDRITVWPGTMKPPCQTFGNIGDDDQKARYRELLPLFADTWCVVCGTERRRQGERTCGWESCEQRESEGVRS